MPLLYLLAPTKVTESVAEGEDKEADGHEEKSVTKSIVKEEVETAELKVETPELKVTTVLLLLT